MHKTPDRLKAKARLAAARISRPAAQRELTRLLVEELAGMDNHFEHNRALYQQAITDALTGDDLHPLQKTTLRAMWSDMELRHDLKWSNPDEPPDPAVNQAFLDAEAEMKAAGVDTRGAWFRPVMDVWHDSEDGNAIYDEIAEFLRAINFNLVAEEPLFTAAHAAACEILMERQRREYQAHSAVDSQSPGAARRLNG